MYKAPEILTIHLKRFKNIHNKIENKVLFPITNFDISDFVVNQDLPSTYDLDERPIVNVKNEEKKEIKVDEPKIKI